mgnify:CR=1 FL=1
MVKSILPQTAKTTRHKKTAYSAVFEEVISLDSHFLFRAGMGSRTPLNRLETCGNADIRYPPSLKLRRGKPAINNLSFATLFGNPASASIRLNEKDIPYFSSVAGLGLAF